MQNTRKLTRIAGFCKRVLVPSFAGAVYAIIFAKKDSEIRNKQIVDDVKKSIACGRTLVILTCYYRRKSKDQI